MIMLKMSIEQGLGSIPREGSWFFNKKLGTNIKRCERVANEQESIFWNKITVVELVTNFELCQVLSVSKNYYLGLKEETKIEYSPIEKCVTKNDTNEAKLIFPYRNCN